MATYSKPALNKHRYSAGCRHGLVCFKKKEDLAALKVPYPPSQQCPLLLRYANNRARSAQVNRREHEASDFFKGKADRDWLKSNYALEYCSKELTSPTVPLPLSPTRMNNPHPNKVTPCCMQSHVASSPAPPLSNEL